MQLVELLKDWPCTVINGERQLSIRGVTERVDRVRPGYLFIARKGQRVDGADYIEQAICQGAAAVVIDRHSVLKRLKIAIPIIVVPDCEPFLAFACSQMAGKPSERLTMIAVTGTNGKTTVTHFISQLLKRQAIRSAIIGTIGVFIDGQKQEWDVPPLTTIPPEDLHAILATCEQLGVTHVVLEASSIGLERHRLDSFHFDIGVLLNIGADHYEEHGGKDAYVAAKKKLFTQCNAMVVNVEDPLCVQLAGDADIPILYFGNDERAVYRPQPSDHFQSVPGKYNQMNAFAALTVLIALGFPLQEVIVHIPSLTLPEGRMQTLQRDGITVVVDYAHTPDALQAILATLRSSCHGHLITVFGCGGERDRSKRSQMGEIAVAYSHHVVITSDNPRRENPNAIIEDILSGFGGACSTVDIHLDRKIAIRQAIFHAAPGDIVLIAGKGHEKVQQTAEGTIPFSDVAIAQQALNEKTYSMQEEFRVE